MLGTLPNNEIEQLLQSQLVGRIGCHADGQTYIVPISYAYDGKFIYCHTHEGLKLDKMRKNPSICFEVEEMVNMANWKSVIIQGIFEELSEKEEKTKAMQTLLNRYLPVISSVTTHLGSHWPFQPDDIMQIKGVVFRIVVKEKTGRFERQEQSPQIPG